MRNGTLSAMADAADQAKDPAVTTPGDVSRDGAEVANHDLAGSQDVPPRKRPGRPKGSKTKAPDYSTPPGEPPSMAVSEAKALRALKKQLTGLLGGPAMIFSEMGEDWPAEHVESRAPVLANAIVARAEKDAAFKKRLQAFLDGGQSAELFLASAMYALPLVIYFTGIGPPPLKSMLGVPPRGKRPGFIAGRAQEGEIVDADISASEMQAEAEQHGFDDPESYKQAVRDAVASVHGPIADAPPPAE
jgi:hypothetical protein